jgi:hypothetical protein
MALYGDMVWFVVMPDDTTGAPSKKRKHAKPSQSNKKKKAKQTEPDTEGKLFVTCIIHTSNQTIKQSNNQQIQTNNQTTKQSNNKSTHTVKEGIVVKQSKIVSLLQSVKIKRLIVGEATLEGGFRQRQIRMNGKTITYKNQTNQTFFLFFLFFLFVCLFFCFFEEYLHTHSSSIKNGGWKGGLGKISVAEMPWTQEEWEDQIIKIGLAKTGSSPPLLIKDTIGPEHWGNIA